MSSTKEQNKDLTPTYLSISILMPLPSENHSSFLEIGISCFVAKSDLFVILGRKE
jgi:hypothetical protein